MIQMNNQRIAAIVLPIFLSCAAPVIAADTDSHTVTVTVNAINEIAVTGEISC